MVNPEDITALLRSENPKEDDHDDLGNPNLQNEQTVGDSGDLPPYLALNKPLESTAATQRPPVFILTSSDQKCNPPQYSWINYSSGSYNKVWRSAFSEPQALVSGEAHGGPWVLKRPILAANPVLNAMNAVSRAIRIWNELNGKHLPKAGPYKQGWVAPFLGETRPSNDDEIAEALVEIYRRHGRIVVDAAVNGNFLTHKSTGQVVLVDVDLALRRRSSVASMAFAVDLDKRYESFWRDVDLNKRKPKTMNLTRNLLFFEDQLNETEVQMLDEKITVKNILALTWLRKHNKPLTSDLFLSLSSLAEADVFSDDLLEALAESTLVNMSSPSTLSQTSAGTTQPKVSGLSIFRPPPDLSKTQEKSGDESALLNKSAPST